MDATLAWAFQKLAMFTNVLVSKKRPGLIYLPEYFYLISHRFIKAHKGWRSLWHKKFKPAEIGWETNSANYPDAIVRWIRRNLRKN